MSIQVGERLPEATLRQFIDGTITNSSVSEVFGGHKAVLFAVPGAFTPACTAQHLPTFVANHAELRAKGVSKIVCIAVNDAFVLSAWQESTEAGDAIEMYSDGNAEFTRAIGMEMDGSPVGLGTRSKRYAMIVDDGVVKHIAIEDNPGVVEVTSAEDMLAVL